MKNAPAGFQEFNSTPLLVFLPSLPLKSKTSLLSACQKLLTSKGDKRPDKDAVMQHSRVFFLFLFIYFQSCFYQLFNPPDGNLRRNGGLVWNFTGTSLNVCVRVRACEYVRLRQGGGKVG